jgi:hypothetical protein
MKLHQAESIKIMKKRGSRGMHVVAEGEREREGAVVPHRDLLPSGPGIDASQKAKTLAAEWARTPVHLPRGVAATGV